MLGKFLTRISSNTQPKTNVVREKMLKLSNQEMCSFGFLAYMSPCKRSNVLVLLSNVSYLFLKLFSFSISRKVVLLPSEMVKKDTSAMNALSQRLSSEDLKGCEKRSCLLTYFSETGKCKLTAIKYVLILIRSAHK